VSKINSLPSEDSHLPKSPGRRPTWNVGDLPAPPQFNLKNVLKIIGPGAITLSVSIGLGEWVLGPAVVSQYGLSLLWIASLAILFQLACNLEFIRYTVYTGEPVVNGFMRLAPHPALWGFLYILFWLCQGGWPAWAATSAAPLFAAFMGDLPGAGDEMLMRLLGIMNFAVCVFIIAVGGKIERTLEFVNWFMVIYIFGFLMTVCVIYVPLETWLAGLRGFLGLDADFQFALLPAGASWVLLGGFAAFAASGGMNNVTISNYIRDKGFGMGGVVGYIPSAVGGKKVNISPVGTVFPTTQENMDKWRIWWKYVLCDQVALWAFGCFVGMFLNCILAAHIIPPGTELEGLAAGAYQASYLEAEGGKLLGFVTLLNGFWILFGSQLVVVDALTRVNTDIVWSMSNRLREIAGGDIRKVYYSLLIIYAVWGSIAINLAPPQALTLIASNAAGFILLFSAINVLVLNKMMLPKAVQGSLWLRSLVVCAVLFYGFFFFMNLRQLFF